jgi:hypothetical protein
MFSTILRGAQPRDSSRDRVNEAVQWRSPPELVPGRPLLGRLKDEDLLRITIF